MLTFQLERPLMFEDSPGLEWNYFVWSGLLRKEIFYCTENKDMRVHRHKLWIQTLCRAREGALGQNRGALTSLHQPKEMTKYLWVILVLTAIVGYSSIVLMQWKRHSVIKWGINILLLAQSNFQAWIYCKHIKLKLTDKLGENCSYYWQYQMKTGIMMWFMTVCKALPTSNFLVPQALYR